MRKNWIRARKRCKKCLRSSSADMCVLSPKLIEHSFWGNMHSSSKNILEQNLGGTHFSVPVGVPGCIHAIYCTYYIESIMVYPVTRDAGLVQK